MTHRRAAMRGVVAVLLAATTGLLIAAPSPVRRTQTPVARSADPPRLIVLIVVDQFRASYLTEYGQQWSKGLRELFSSGAVYTEAVVPYAVTRTCTGHATIATGTYPSTHGMVDNEWFDRAEHRFIACTEDRSVEPLSFGPGSAVEHHSARSLRAPTFADELRRQAKRPPQVVSIGLKARAAISLVGQGGPRTLAIWEEDNGTWATSTAYATVPSAEIASFAKARAAATARGSVWNRLLPASAYVYQDVAPGEPDGGAFPRVIASPLGVSISAAWDSSPFSDSFVGDLAVTLVGSLGLGQEPGTDLLLLGFSALDYVGHRFGPRSHEVQDMLARLDVTIGRLVDLLDRTVGRERYVVALTSDHGVAPLPEQGGGPGVPGGRVSAGAIGRAVETALAIALGRPTSVEAISGTSVYLEPGVLDKIRAAPAARRLVERAVLGVPGVARVFWADEMASGAEAADDAIAIAMRRSYVADRSGDLMFVPQRYWVVADGGTQHGTPYDYDTRVPLVFAGRRIAAGHYSSPASLADVAPTLAALAGVKFPRTDGRSLSEITDR